MTVPEAAEFTALGAAAGLFGSVIGIGAGILIVPLLVLAFHFDFRVAVAVSLVAVIANSSAAGAAYSGEGLTNKRLAMSLEIGTGLGGVTGGLVTTLFPRPVLEGVFALMMAASGAMVARGRGEGGERESGGGGSRGPDLQWSEALGDLGGWERPGSLDGAYRERDGRVVVYEPVRPALGSAVAYLAGLMSGLLGVGGGFLKVPAMTNGMRVPVRVAAATSNFMIGVTATSGLFIYFIRGYVHPLAAAPWALGVTGGAAAGAVASQHMAPGLLRKIFGAVLAVAAVLMALRAIGAVHG